jgi:hypothetical protein
VRAQEIEGTLDSVSEKGLVVGGSRLSYSKWFEGDRPTQDWLGCTVRILADIGDKCSFVKRILSIGAKVPGWKPPEKLDKGYWGGGGRRLSPEELELRRDEGTRIARSVAVDRAISMSEKGITLEKIGDLALAIEAYILKGDLSKAAKAAPTEAPGKEGNGTLPNTSRVSSVPEPGPESAHPPAPAKEAAPKAGAKPKRLASQAVNALFNDALRGGVVDDWADFLQIVEDVLKVKGKSPYQLDIPSFEKLASAIRAKLGQESAA